MKHQKHCNFSVAPVSPARQLIRGLREFSVACQIIAEKLERQERDIAEQLARIESDVALELEG